MRALPRPPARSVSRTSRQRAKQLAASAYADPRGNVPRWLLDLNYDQYRDIRFRPERALWSDRKLPFSVQFFHPGFFYDRTVILHVVSASGAVSPVTFSPDQFDYGRNNFEGRVPQDLGYAGFRIHYPIKSTSYHDEVAAFLGASYFRAVGRDQVYGLSARGVAINTALSSGEEFPWFREFWLVQPAPGAQELTLYALLDSPSATGAYRFVVAPGPQTHVDVEMRLFPRTPFGKLGIAPLTSMFLHGENGTGEVADYRPEVHDSDGLLVAASSGEWLWRPLAEPAGSQRHVLRAGEPARVRSRAARPGLRSLPGHRSPAGSATQRMGPARRASGARGASSSSRSRRATTPTTTSSPIGCPRWPPRRTRPSPMPIRCSGTATIAAGRRVEDRSQPDAMAARTQGARRLVVDFEGEALRRMPADAVVEGRVTMIPSQGAGAGVPQPAELLEQQVIRNPATGGWRLVLQVKPPDDDPVELRAFLRHGADAVTETWSYLLVP